MKTKVTRIALTILGLTIVSCGKDNASQEAPKTQEQTQTVEAPTSAPYGMIARVNSSALNRLDVAMVSTKTDLSSNDKLAAAFQAGKKFSAKKAGNNQWVVVSNDVSPETQQFAVGKTFSLSDAAKYAKVTRLNYADTVDQLNTSYPAFGTNPYDPYYDPNTTIVAPTVPAVVTTGSPLDAILGFIFPLLEWVNYLSMTILNVSTTIAVLQNLFGDGNNNIVTPVVVSRQAYTVASTQAASQIIYKPIIFPDQK